MFSIAQSGLVGEGWKTPYIPTLFVISVILLTIFGFWEHHAEKHSTTPPIVKLGVFTRHHWRLSVILAIAFFDCDEQSVAGALFQVALQIAGTIDVCLSALIQTEVEAEKGLLVGLRTSFWFNAACYWFVLVIVLLAFRKVGLAKDVAKVV